MDTYDYSIEDASTTDERCYAIAQAQQSDSDTAANQLQEAAATSDEAADFYNSIAAILAEPLDPQDHLPGVVTHKESQAATLARATFGIEGIVFNDNGGTRGTAGNSKGSRAASRAVRAANRAQRQARSAILAAARNAK